MISHAPSPSPCCERSQRREDRQGRGLAHAGADPLAPLSGSLDRAERAPGPRHRVLLLAGDHRGVGWLRPAQRPRNPASLVGGDPTHVGAWEEQMGGAPRRERWPRRRRARDRHVGPDRKAAGLPVYRLLGAVTDRVKVYAATNRLLSAEETVEQVQGIVAEGFRAVSCACTAPTRATTWPWCAPCARHWVMTSESSSMQPEQRLGGVRLLVAPDGRRMARTSMNWASTTSRSAAARRH